ncbi:MAG: hypothetical protein QOE70_2648 [Chthoniobacter sp.]|jgi:hypothetical protein|nr:hypothetical protein [Chthoniobacter sp.]
MRREERVSAWSLGKSLLKHSTLNHFASQEPEYFPEPLSFVLF